ncbi:MAG TPA: FGGY family carbohydrate kinase [Chitinophagaceae bacterium]
MNTTAVIAVIDVGKTNKKLLLFDQEYRIVYEQSARFPESTDEDGDPCEDLESLRQLVSDSLQTVLQCKEFRVKAVNFAAYGASFVYLDEKGQPMAPLYNYLKPYPESLKEQFYGEYGGEEKVSFETASPVLCSLNSGMQLYRVKFEKPELFRRIKYALHLPQYLSYLVSGTPCSEITSIGCHTQLWNFQTKFYHQWVYREGIIEKFPPLWPSDRLMPTSSPGAGYGVGVGLHDSSAALIPYLVSFREPFVLISTGTWCISLNSFNDTPLTPEELRQDCLCYLSYQGTPVKASRLFAGQEHEDGVNRIAAHFNQAPEYYHILPFEPETVAALQQRTKDPIGASFSKGGLRISQFAARSMTSFASGKEAYHQLIMDIVALQQQATGLVINGSPVKRIFVDGGFSKNDIYMNLLATAFPQMEVYAASIAQATSLGAALAVHEEWNEKPLPHNIVQLKHFTGAQHAVS